MLSPWRPAGARGAWALLWLWSGGLLSATAYRTWHVVDTEAAVCSQPTASTAPNLAQGKDVTVGAGLRHEGTNSLATVTDGSREFLPLLNPWSGYLAGVDAYQDTVATRCDLGVSGNWATVDLGSLQTLNKVVLFQYDPASPDELYCGHKVEVSDDGSTYRAAYTHPDGLFARSGGPNGAEMLFPSVTARYVRVHSAGSPTHLNFFAEVEIYNQLAEQYEIEINPSSFDWDGSMPHILTMIRASLAPYTIEIESVTDASGSEVIYPSSFGLTLPSVEPGPAAPGSCGCTGQIAPGSMDYGESCKAWDLDPEMCSSMWTEEFSGPQCCRSWCFSDRSCPDAVKSPLMEGAYMSYRACGVVDPYGNEVFCGIEPADPCKCLDKSSEFDSAMRARFGGVAGGPYGSKCKAWDDGTCEQDYNVSDLDTWCCSEWCYVSPTCPHAKQSLNPGMEEKLFWTEMACDTPAENIIQCPYQATSNRGGFALDKCACLGIQMSSTILMAGMPADYGKTCKPHDKDSCETWYPNFARDMWCCMPWCWVSSECPNAMESTVWSGRYYSSLPCDLQATESVAALTTCTYSTACNCINSNTGVDTARFPANYGTACQAWDQVGCYETWHATSDIWSATARNDWCCQSWCYVSESCPLAQGSLIGSSLPYSYVACTDSGKIYKESTNTCVDPITSCSCLPEQMPTPPSGMPASYGTSCAAHDKDNCGLATPGMACCRSWCFVDETCSTAVRSTAWPGHWLSYRACAVDEAAAAALRDCKYSNLCKCVGDNAGLPATWNQTFSANYGESCAAWDSKACASHWGPSSTTNLFGSGAGANDWCCDNWCYISQDCTWLAEGFGMAIYPYSYKACDNTDPRPYDSGADTCPAAAVNTVSNWPTRRLAEAAGAPTPSVVPPAAGAPTPFLVPPAPTPSVVPPDLAEEEWLEDGDGCEDFFFLDGRSPAELPDTWSEARRALRAICRAEGFDADVCGAGEKLVFKGYPSGDEVLRGSGRLCSRLLVAAAAVAQGARTDLELPAGAHARAREATELAGSMQDLFFQRASAAPGRATPAAPAGDALDGVLMKKVMALGEGRQRAQLSAPGRRLKGSGGSGGYSSGDSGGGWWGGGESPTPTPSPSPPPPVPALRRRTPSRPSISSSLRRRAPAPPSSANHRRRGTGLYAGQGVRTPSDDITGSDRSKTLPSVRDGASTPYGYTDAGELFRDYRGQVPFFDEKTFSGQVKYQKDDMLRLNMNGVGSHFANNVNNMVHRRRRGMAGSEWCIDPEQNVVQCDQCQGVCVSSSECMKPGGGCTRTLSSSKVFRRDELRSTGFIPKLWQMPLKIKIKSIQASGLSCPSEPSSVLVPEFYLTLTQQDVLSVQRPDFSYVEPDPNCRKFTGFQCKPGATLGAVGLDACYGAQEECLADPGGGQEPYCFCKAPHYCLEGTGAAASCHDPGEMVAGSAGLGSAPGLWLAAAVALAAAAA